MAERSTRHLLGSPRRARRLGARGLGSPGLVAALGALLLAGTAPAARADEVSVAVAANFAVPLQEIGKAFSAATGHVIRASAGPTGKFYTQIVAGGAPYEVLVAADDETPRRLVAEGHAVAGSAFTYAIGQLVLWSAQPGLVDEQGTVLAGHRFSKLAIANPKVAPYGQAAMEVLKARGLADALRPRLVTAETVTQAQQWVLSGNAELGFLPLSQVQQPGKPAGGSLWRVPSSLHTEIRQDAVLLKPGEKKPAAQALLAWLKTDAAKALIGAYGYK